MHTFIFADSAKVLVRGEPNVSYICSRYYRAPELIFGATDYTSQIGMCLCHTRSLCNQFLSKQSKFMNKRQCCHIVTKVMSLLLDPSGKAVFPAHKGWSFERALGLDSFYAHHSQHVTLHCYFIINDCTSFCYGSDSVTVA